jgi:hypothetical protein
MKRFALPVVVLLVVACASLLPSMPATVQFDGWTATCSDVERDDCDGVAGLFVNNLARNWKSVLDESGGRIHVATRPSCPAVPDWADPRLCWQATAGSICMIIARNMHPGGAGFAFGQVGGDEMAGRAGPPPSGWPKCQ